MNSKDDARFFSRLGIWIRATYTKVREPVGYLLIVLTIIGTILQSPKLQVGAIGILCTIILRLLFEIHERTGVATTRQFESLADARDEIKACLRAALKQDRYIRIQWLGGTMFNVWNTMEDVFDWLASEMQAPRVRFEVAMLDSEWLRQNRINAAWTNVRADVIEENIQHYPKRDPEKLQGLDWVFEVRRYAHMPVLHGGLINGKYLFVGISRWEGRTLRAGDRRFELYTFKDGEAALDKIAVFRNWFNFSFGEKPTWYTPASNRAQHQPPTTLGNAA